ncbi:MAG TPA: hypothetical protein VES02_03125 [Dermatophilaceae bacterium]|nr:hypothetical protein [Dermatophilaceae bacterium]
MIDGSSLLHVLLTTQVHTAHPDDAFVEYGQQVGGRPVEGQRRQVAERLRSRDALNLYEQSAPARRTAGRRGPVVLGIAVSVVHSITAAISPT